MSASELVGAAQRHAGAFVAVAMKAWRMQLRQGWFWRIGILGALTITLPPLLNARALAGPDESQAARFAETAGTDNYLAFTSIGIVAMASVAITMQQVALGLAHERAMGTLSSAWTSRSPRMLLFCADATGRAVAQTGFGFLGFAAVWALFRFEMTVSTAALAAVLLASFAASIATGILVAGPIIRYRDAGMLFVLLTLGAGIAAGIAYPTTVLPGWAQAIGHALPLTWILRGLRAALVYGDTARAYEATAVLLSMAAVFGVAGWLLFSRMERAARRRGVLESF